MDINAWWAQKQAEGKDAIEAAREFGVDIEQLRLMRSITPTQRLRLLQARSRFVRMAQASMLKQRSTKEELIITKETANRVKDQVHLITLRALKQMEDEEAGTSE